MACLSMNELTTYRWSFDEDVENYASAGLGGIGIWRQKLSDFGEEKGIDLLQEAGLSVSSLLWAGGFTGSDGRSYKESVFDGCEATRLAARLRASCLVVYSGARAGHTYNHARRLFKNALGEMLPVAAEYDVTLAVEPMHEGCASEWTFLTTLSDGLDLITDIGHPALKLVLDTYHLGHEPSLVEQLPDIAEHLAIVQLGDGRVPPQGEQNRCRLGEGAVPLSRILGALAQSGYQGCYDIELMGEEIESTDYHELLRHSKQKFDTWSQAASTDPG